MWTWAGTGQACGHGGSGTIPVSTSQLTDQLTDEIWCSWSGERTYLLLQLCRVCLLPLYVMGWEAIALVRNHCKRNGWNVFSSTFFLCCFMFFSFIKNNCFQFSCRFCWGVPSVDPWLNKGQGQSRHNSQLLWERTYSISMSCLRHFSVGLCHPAGFI